MKKKALLVWGGWDGHTPKQSVEVIAPELEAAGMAVEITGSLDAYLDPARLRECAVVVQCVTMSEISADQWKGLSEAVRSGVGFGGWHGGVLDSFRNNTDYQWMVGGQWVAHPGGCIPTHRVEITNPDHEITRGLHAFDLPGTEQYYLHVDPAVDILCTTTFSGEHGEPGSHRAGTVMPYAWTKNWGVGRVFAAAWGHTFKDFEVPEAREIVRRGLLWAGRTG